MTVPYIDPSIKHVGVSKLRDLNAQVLKQLKGALVIQDGDQPLAVIINYRTFLRMQRELSNLNRYLDSQIRR